MFNKKGQGLSTNAIIMIVLGILVLAVLVFGFYAGWEKISPWISSENVDNVVGACATSCSTAKIYDFCSKERTLISDDLPTGKDEATGTCKFFATNLEYTKYGVKDCPGLCAE